MLEVLGAIAFMAILIIFIVWGIIVNISFLLDICKILAIIIVLALIAWLGGFI